MNMLKQQMVPVQCVEDDAGMDQRRSCLAGLYLLTGEGALTRFDSEGRLTMEIELSARLSLSLQEALDRYRSGGGGELSLGLITDPEFSQAWGTGTLVFSDRALSGLFDAEHYSGLPLPPCELGSKTWAVFQGMELLLNKTKPAEPVIPRFCPVLFVPEDDHRTLCERYGVDLSGSHDLFEVLDLAAPVASNIRMPDELASMVRHMRQTQMEAAFCTYSDVGKPGSENAPSTPAMGASDANHTAPDGFDPAGEICFEEGDILTGWLLEWFSPFNELTDTQREIIAGYETIHKVFAGTRLIEQGAGDDACIYLVEGVLSLEDRSGGTIRVKGGTRRSRLPISVMNPHVHKVTAVTDASIVVFSQRLVRKITEITRTYTSIDRRRVPEASTAEISNGVQSVYLNPVYPPWRDGTEPD